MTNRDEAEALERINMALSMMAAGGPRDLRAYLAQPGPDFIKAGSAYVDRMIDLLLSADPNHPARLRFSDLLRSWDNEPDPKWARGSARNSESRRALIHECLVSGPALQQRIDALIPFYHLDEPVVIAETHEEWYKPQAGVRDYYWRTYLRYLKEKRKWDEVSLLALGNSTRAIVECLANPESPEAYASRGLVMGFVQSGKTANFTGVVSRAADAGYRLTIVLAGTWNILRNQTQRRFDKDLLGKELLRNDESYTAHPPADWEEFLEHGRDPVALGHYTWQRLTRPDIDFRRLKAAIDNLEFEKLNRALPIYDPSNLHSLPVKLLVVKKNSAILANLFKDLQLLKTRLTDLPALIIDDESDQAGLNTVDPQLTRTEGMIERSKINQRIVDLLSLFPRGQYVGYTATPYANALVNPDDPVDLFPRDFIISLERPRGYMGVSSFFDPAIEYQDLPKDDYSQPEVAHIRRVENLPGSDDEDLKKALRSYVLAGSIKLLRLERDGERYRHEHFKHHTMLVHTSSRRGEHATVAGRLKELWDQCAFNTPQGLSDLEALWTDDYSKVCLARGDEVLPDNIEQLVPFLSETIRRIESGPQVFQVVNSDTSEAPDFSAAPVWKIVIGGNKLSRGYTIEGLTVSYYRRVAGTADTLMQMGRWFGFRPGYYDLVRVFLGVKEGRDEVDLVSHFKDVCRMEERFRDEIRRYIRRPGVKPITPRDIPPLVSASGDLPPTARNKMFNSVLASKNFGGQRSMLTLTAATDVGMEKNVEGFKKLAKVSRPLGRVLLGGSTALGKRIEAIAVVLETTNADLIEFLKAYRWLEAQYTYPQRPADAGLQIEFLEKQNHGIQSWLIMAPQRQVSFGLGLKLGSGQDLTVKERHRVSGRGFQVFGEPAHRTIAEYLAGIERGKSELAVPDESSARMRNDHRGVCLLYPVRESEQGEISIGFELLFPENDLPFDLNFTVRRRGEAGKVVVDV